VGALIGKLEVGFMEHDRLLKEKRRAITTILPPLEELERQIAEDADTKE